MDNYWKNYNKELLTTRLKQCNLSKEQYDELKDFIHVLIKGLNSEGFEEAKFVYDVIKNQKISFSDMSTPIMYDEDTIKLIEQLYKSKKWVFTSKNPDNIRKRYPNVIDIRVHNLGGNGGINTLIRWK